MSRPGNKWTIKLANRYVSKGASHYVIKLESRCVNKQGSLQARKEMGWCCIVSLAENVFFRRLGVCSELTPYLHIPKSTVVTYFHWIVAFGRLVDYF